MNYKTTAVLLIVLAFGLILVWLIGSSAETQTAPVATPSPKPQTGRVLDPVPTKITKAAMSRPNLDQIVFELEEGDEGDPEQWRLTAPIAAKAKNHEVRTLVNAFKDLESRDEFTPSEGDVSLESAGLSNGKTTVELTYMDTADQERRAIISIGKRVPLTSDTYVMLDGAKKAYIAKTDLNKTLDKELNEFRDPDLMDFERDQVVRAEFIMSDMTILAVKSDDDWVLEKPVKARADNSKLDPIFNSMRGLTANEFVNDNPENLSKYGLDAPRLRVNLTLEEKLVDDTAQKEDSEAGSGESESAATDPSAEKFRKWEMGLAFGSFADLEEERIYAQVLDSGSVVEVDKFDLDKIKPDLFELRDKRVVDEDVTKAVKVRLQAGGQTTVIVKDKIWKMTEPIEAKAEGAAVLDLLNGLKNLKAQQFLDVQGDEEERLGFDSPQLKIAAVVEGRVKPIELTLGSTTSSGFSTFVRNDSTGTISVVSADDLESVTVAPLSFRSREIFKFDKEKALVIRVDDADRGAFEIEKRDGRWYLKAPVEAEAEQPSVRALLSDLQALRAKRYVEQGNLQKYGQDEPSLKISVTVSAAEDAETPDQYELWLGKDPQNTTAFGRLPNNEFVFEVSESLYTHASAEMHLREILEFDAVDADRLSVVSHGRKDRTFEKKEGAWSLAGDVYFQVKEKTLEKALQSLAALKAERFVAYADPNLAEYALDAPQIRIEVRTPGAVGVLLLSGENDEGRRYGTLDGAHRIFLINESALADIDKPLRDFSQ